MMPGIIPAEPAAEHVRNSLQMLMSARHGATVSGESARLLTTDEFATVMLRLNTAVALLEAAERAAVTGGA